MEGGILLPPTVRLGEAVYLLTIVELLSSMPAGLRFHRHLRHIAPGTVALPVVPEAGAVFPHLGAPCMLILNRFMMAISVKVFVLECII